MSDWQTFLASRGAHHGPAGVENFGNRAAELAAARDGTLLADLSHNALLSVSGDDAVGFLHGQLTNDVERLPPGAAQWTGWCNPKGRLIATFLLLKRAENACLLLLPAAIAPAIARRLSMFVLRSKVKIADAGAGIARIGFAGRSAAVLVGQRFGHAPDPMRSVEKDAATCIALDAQRFVVLAPVERAISLWGVLSANATPAGRDAWEWMAIRAGIPAIGAGTQEEFVPQMANFEAIGGVSFKKGCYPGQEIVARTQYRGILKKRMVIAHLASDAAPRPGDDLRTASLGEQSAGKVVNVAPSPEGGFDLLAVAPIEGIEAGDLRLADGTRLELLELPYALPASA